MELTKAYLYEKTKQYVPGWCFKFTNNYGSKNYHNKEEVKVLETYPNHIVVTNGKYTYSISRYDLFAQKHAKEIANNEQ